MEILIEEVILKNSQMTGAAPPSLLDGEIAINSADDKIFYKKGERVVGRSLLPPASSGVTSVNTRTGAVVLTKADANLGNVDNTSDSNKPISTAQAAALASKAPILNASHTGTFTVDSDTDPISLISYENISFGDVAQTGSGTRLVINDNAGEISSNGLWLHTGAINVSDSPYSAAGWDNSTAVPTRNAVRDKIEAVAALVPAFIDNETPSGAIDGSNTAFTIANAAVAGSERLYIEGYLLSGNGNDYSLAGTTLTLIVAPLAGERMKISYRK